MWEMGRKAEGKGGAKRGEENQRNKGIEAGQRETEALPFVMPIIHEGLNRLISLRGGLPPKYHSMPETMLVTSL